MNWGHLIYGVLFVDGVILGMLMLVLARAIWRGA